MSPREVFFTALVLALVSALAWIAVKAVLRNRRSANGSWDTLLGRLVIIDRLALKEVALDIVDQTGEPRKDDERAMLSSDQVWILLGGLEGLERIEANCKVLIEMASYLQRWYPESLAVAESLRLGAREISWHVARIKAASKTGKLEATFLMYAQPAAAAYYRMTRLVLALYAATDDAMLDQLEKAL
jgi:hypothetical protein